LGGVVGGQVGGGGRDQLPARNRGRRREGEVGGAARIGAHVDAAEEDVALAEARRVALWHTKEFQAEGGQRHAVECSTDDRGVPLSQGGGQHGEVLQVIGPRVGIARVVGGHTEFI